MIATVTTKEGTTIRVETSDSSLTVSTNSRGEVQIRTHQDVSQKESANPGASHLEDDPLAALVGTSLAEDLLGTATGPLVSEGGSDRAACARGSVDPRRRVAEAPPELSRIERSRMKRRVPADSTATSSRQRVV